MKIVLDEALLRLPAMTDHRWAMDCLSRRIRAAGNTWHVNFIIGGK